jgi:hypothetical protein
MTLSALGIFSAAGAGGVQGDYELIQTQIVSGSSTSSVLLDNLGTFSSTYKHLQVRATVRTDNAALWGTMSVRLNGDSGSNYSVHRLWADGTVYSTSAPTTSSIINDFVAGNTSPTGSFAATVIDLLDTFSTTKNKTARLFTGRLVGTGETAVALTSGHWRNTSSITSVTFAPINGTNFIAGSRFSIYGLRG